MRIRTLLPVLALFLTSASIVPARAVGVPVMSCKWKGLVHIDSDWSWEGVLMDLGPGQGRCTGTGAGPWDITFIQGHGGVEGPNLFSWSVNYRLTSDRNGSARSFYQDWDGRETSDCTMGPFRVERYIQIPVGVGTMSLCPTVDAFLPPPEPIDVPIEFTWKFVPGRLVA